MRATIGLGLLLVASACHVPAHRMELFAHTAQPATADLGRTVGVLPPHAVGSQHALAANWRRGVESVFAGELGGATFVPPSEIAPRYADDVDAFAALLDAVSVGLPADFGSDGEERTLLESHFQEPDGVDPDRVVTMREAVGVASLAPERVDPALLAPAGTDDVLVIVPYTYHVTALNIVAIYGVLPIMGTSGIKTLTPRALLALYDASTGARRWEACVATAPRPPGRKGHPGISHEVEPIVGAAALLTGEVAEALRRLGPDAGEEPRS